MQAADFRLEVPGPPRGVARPRSRIVTTRTGQQFIGVHTDKKTRVEAAVIRQMAGEVMGKRAPLDGPLELRVAAYMPVPSSWSGKRTREAIAGLILPTGKPDFDNIVKFIDALKHIAFKDDGQIADAHVWKRYSDRPRLVIELRQLGLS